MNEPRPTIHCDRCDALILEEELEDGLAIRIGGKPICPACVDQLPDRAKVRINQMRAMRGIPTTVYRYRHPQWPQLNAFTFSTTFGVMRHRRALNRDEAFDAPVLGAHNSPLPTVSSSEETELLILGRRRHAAIALTAAGAIILVIALLATASRGSEVPVLPVSNRADFPDDSREAFAQATIRLDTDDPLRQELAQEIIDQQQPLWRQVADAMADHRPDEARRLLATIALPADPLFDTERRRIALTAERIDTLAQRSQQPPEPVVIPEEIIDSDPISPPEPDTIIAEATDHDDEHDQAEPAAPVQHWRIAAEDLLTDPASADWDAQSGRGLRLNSDIGSLSRRLHVQPGRYRLWIQLRGVGDGGSLEIVLGDARFTITSDINLGQRSQWYPMDGMPLEMAEEQIIALDLTARRAGWDIHRLLIADHRLEGSPVGINDIPAVTWWQPEPEPEPEPQPVAPPPPPQVQHPIPRFTAEISEVDSYAHPQALSRLGVDFRLPGGIPRILFASERQLRWTPTGRPHGMEIRLDGLAVDDGGLVLHVHPVRADRTQLQVELFDDQGRRLRLNPLSFPTTDWHSVAIDFSGIPPARDDSRDFDPTQLSHLRLRDSEDRLSTPFLLARMATVRDRPPQPEDIGLRHRALAPTDMGALRDLIQKTWRNRRQGDWRSGMKPAKTKFLFGTRMWVGNFRTRVYDALEEEDGERPPDRSVQQLVMLDEWLDETFIIPPELIDSTHHHMIAVVSAGTEFVSGLNLRQAQFNFWRKLIDEAIRSGVLPVVVLGPNKLTEEQVIQAEELWQRLTEMLAKDYPGVPIIDLRLVPTAGSERFPAGSAQMTIDLLMDGYNELKQRIESLRHARP